MAEATSRRTIRRAWLGAAGATLALLLSCSSETSHGSRTSPDSGEPGGTAGTHGAGGSGGTVNTGGNAGSSNTAGGASGSNGSGGTSGASGAGGAAGSGGRGGGGAGGAFFDGGRAPGFDSGSCVPGGPCKLSVGPCHIGTVFCDAVGIGWCRDDGPVAEGTHCGTHGTCNAGTCVETTPCNVTYNCTAGQTCWTKDGYWFDCLASGPGAVGQACDPSTWATVSCGDGLECVGAGSLGGRCTAWCNSTPCPAGKTCTSVTTTKGVTLQLCF